MQSEVMAVEGFSDLEDALDDLSKAAGKGVLRRSAIGALRPMAALAASLAPDDPATSENDLKDSIIVGTRLHKRFARAARADRATTAITVYMGPSSDVARKAGLQEFGTAHHPAQPYMRPAWDRDHKDMLERLGELLWQEFDKSLQRAQRKAAKLAASGG